MQLDINLLHICILIVIVIVANIVVGGSTIIVGRWSILHPWGRSGMVFSSSSTSCCCYRVSDSWLHLMIPGPINVFLHLLLLVFIIIQIIPIVVVIVIIIINAIIDCLMPPCCLIVILAFRDRNTYTSAGGGERLDEQEF